MFYQLITYILIFILSFGAKNMILRNLVFFLSFLFVGKRFFSPIPWNKRRWWNIHSMELTPKKEGNYNVVATWPCHVILLVITSNNILLSLPIALTYYFIPDGSLFWYTKSYSSIIKNCFLYTALLKSALAVILFVGKHTTRDYTLLGLISSLLPPLLPYNHWVIGSKMAIDLSRDFFELYP